MKLKKEKLHKLLNDKKVGIPIMKIASSNMRALTWESSFMEWSYIQTSYEIKSNWKKKKKNTYHTPSTSCPIIQGSNATWI